MTQLKSYDLEEFLNEDFGLSGQDHLVETFVPTGGAVLIYAVPKLLKTWIALDLAVAAACGQDFLGRFSVPKPVRVLLVQIEDRTVELQKRLLNIVTANGSLPAQGMLKIIPRRSLNLMDKACRKEFHKVLAQVRPDIVILDVFRRFFRGDVNSPKESAEFLEILDEFRDEHGCAIVLVHHSRKDTKGGMQTHALGSTYLAAWADVLIQITNKQTQGDSISVELEIESKSGSEPDPVRVVFNPNGSPILVAKSGGRDSEIERARAALEEKWTVKELTTVLGVSAAKAQRLIDDWVATDEVDLVETQQYGRRVYRFKPMKLV